MMLKQARADPSKWRITRANLARAAQPLFQSDAINNAAVSGTFDAAFMVAVGAVKIARCRIVGTSLDLYPLRASRACNFLQPRKHRASYSPPLVGTAHGEQQEMGVVI